METTIFPVCVDQVRHTITDQQAQTHTIELSDETLLLDGSPPPSAWLMLICAS